MVDCVAATVMMPEPAGAELVDELADAALDDAPAEDATLLAATELAELELTPEPPVYSMRMELMLTTAPDSVRRVMKDALVPIESEMVMVLPALNSEIAVL
jgi:hypothetical protein